MILDRFGLDGKVAVVTGAGQGIGRGIAVGLAEAGADVALAARTESDLEDVAGLVRRVGRDALVVPTDVTETEARKRLVDQTVERFGRLDVLVNNAGGTMPRAAIDTSERFLEQAFRFNVTSAFELTKLAARAMVDTSGERGVLVGDGHGLRGRRRRREPVDLRAGPAARAVALKRPRSEATLSAAPAVP